jgi:hypothetical protein
MSKSSQYTGNLPGWLRYGNPKADVQKMAQGRAGGFLWRLVACNDDGNKPGNAGKYL